MTAGVIRMLSGKFRSVFLERDGIFHSPALRSLFCVFGGGIVIINNM